MKFLTSDQTVTTEGGTVIAELNYNSGQLIFCHALTNNYIEKIVNFICENVIDGNSGNLVNRNEFDVVKI